MNPQLLAAAYFLQRLHGAPFAASFLEEHGIAREQALQLLADRPPEQPGLRTRVQYPIEIEHLDNQK